MIRTKSVDGKPAVLQGEHVGGGRGVEQPLHAEPPDHAATHPLGERGQVSLTAKRVREGLERVGVKTLSIEPGSPWENGYVESFNGKL